MKKITEVLDCTLRDGGYYNRLLCMISHCLDLVREYLKSISTLVLFGIKIIELGF